MDSNILEHLRVLVIRDPGRVSARLLLRPRSGRSLLGDNYCILTTRDRECGLVQAREVETEEGLDFATRGQGDTGTRSKETRFRNPLRLLPVTASPCRRVAPNPRRCGKIRPCHSRISNIRI